MTTFVIVISAILVAIVVGMINPIAAVGGITIGILWARRSPWTFLGIAVTFVTLIAAQAISLRGLQAYSGVFFIVGQSCSTALWALIARAVARFWQKKVTMAR